MPEPKEFEYFSDDGKAACVGSLDGRGIVTFAILVQPDSLIRGTAVFNKMMDHFGDDAIAIHGFWIRGEKGSPSINIDKVNELTRAGMPLEEAVMHAWTVTRARKRGFVTVSVLRAEPKDVPGTYTKLEVLIQK